MNPIKVNRLKMISRVEAARDAYAAEVAIERDKVREDVQRELEKVLDDVRAGRAFPNSVRVAHVEDHLHEFDALLDLLKATEEELVEVDTSTWSWAVQNNWTWRLW